MRGISLRGAAAVAVVAGSLAACSALLPGPDDRAQTELNRQQRQWREQGIADYAYTVRRLCYCPETFTAPVTVTVRDEEVRSRIYEDGGEGVAAENARFWPGVEGLFAIVQDAIERDADSIDVDYHPHLGYPTSIVIDYERRAVDEELTVTASELHR